MTQTTSQDELPDAVRSDRFRPDIQGLRAIAVLLVVACHAQIPGFEGGFIGVDIFFVISGFLITGQLLRELETTGQVRLVAFWSRRMLRLLPLAWVVIIASAVGITLLLDPFEQLGQMNNVLASTLWVQNLNLASQKADYFADDSRSNVLLHYWSLGVEEQFYLLWPILLQGLWLLCKSTNAKNRRSRLLTAFGLICTAGLIEALHLTQTDAGWAYYGTQARIWQFAAGAAASVLLANGTNSSRLPHWASLVGWALIILSLFVTDDHHAYPGWRAIVPTAATALLLASPSGLGNRALGLPPFQWLGRLSYGWYLWHWPLLVLGSFIGLVGVAPRLALVAIALLCAQICHSAFENRIRHCPQLRSRPLLVVAGGLGGAALGVLMLFHWQNLANLWEQTPPSADLAAALHDMPRIYRDGCDPDLDSAKLIECRYDIPSAETTVVLFGDSHAGALFPAIQSVANANRWRLIVMTKSSCPAIDAPIFSARLHRDFHECSEWQRAALRRISEIKPALIITASADSYQLTDTQLLQGLERMWQALAQSSRQIVAITPTPTLTFKGPACLIRQSWQLNWFKWKIPGAAATCSIPLEQAQHKHTTELMQTARTDFPTVTLLTLDTEICANNTCSARDDGMVTYRDNQHLTARFAGTLEEPIAQALDALNINTSASQ